MTVLIQLAAERAINADALSKLYQAAFPDEDLVPLVCELNGLGDEVTAFGAYLDDDLIAHMALSICTISDSQDRLALLGPLAVHPGSQRQGLGGGLIKKGIEVMRPDTAKILVLGDPDYYGRFGFRKEASIQPPFDLPEEWDAAWQSLALTDGGETISGRLRVPSVWNQRHYWAP